jgi:VHL beta domain
MHYVRRQFTSRSLILLYVAALLALSSSVVLGTLPVGAQLGCNPGGGNNAKSVEFANLGATAVDVKWLNFQCGETFYRTVPGGQSYVQQTYVSHLWRFYEVGTGRLLKEERIADQTRIEFGETAVPVATQPAATPTATTPTTPPSTTVSVAVNAVPTFPGSGAQRTRPNGKQTCDPGGGNNKKDVTFKNLTPNTIEVWWVGFDCLEHLYATVPAGSQYLQQTFVTHRWRFYEAPSGAASKLLCGLAPPDKECLHGTEPSGGSVVYKEDVIGTQEAIEVSLPKIFDSALQPVVKAKASGANAVVFTWTVPAVSTATCVSISATVRKGSVEATRSEACLAIPANRSVIMSATVVVDAARVKKLKLTKAPLTYSAKVSLVVGPSGAVGLPGAVSG